MTTAKLHRLLPLAFALFLMLAPAGGLWRILAAPPPPNSRPVIHYVLHNSRKYLRISDIARFYHFTATTRITSKEKTITLTNKHGQKLVFTDDRLQCTIDGYQVNCCYKVFFHRGEFHLEQTDFTYLIDPILRSSKIPSRAVKTIVLDPGHGGKDQGAAYGKTLEKSINLLLAKRIRSILQRRGYTVFMTREKDIDLSLEARAKFCAAKRPDLFISIHCNAAELDSIDGIEVWAANPPGVPSYGTSKLGEEVVGTKPEILVPNALLSYLALKSLVKATNATDRGVRRKQFYVLRHSVAPAILVEFGFLSNEAERKKMLDSSYQDKLCVAICDAVDQFAKLVKPQPASKPAPPKPRHPGPPPRNRK